MAGQDSDVAADVRVIDEHDGGIGWIAHPDEPMQRASHALLVDGDVWLVDPVDAAGLDDVLAEYGEVAGVVVLLDRHKRDADALARRHGVSIHLPDPLGGIADAFEAPVERFRHDLADTGYAAYPVVDRSWWREAALYSEATGVLVVPEALGSTEFFCVGDERLGVHVGLRPRPPRSLGRLTPERVLVGHGAGVHEAAAEAVSHALDGARRRAPRLYWQTLKALVAG